MLNTHENTALSSTAEQGEFFEFLCSCASVRRAARAVTQLFEEVLAPSGVSISQFIVLQILHDHGPVPQCRLSEGMFVAAETISRRLGLMRRMGWIQLQPGKDRRQRLYALTDLGQKKFDLALPYWIRAQKRLEKTMGEEQMRETKRKLGALTKAAQAAVWARFPNVA